MARKNQLSLLYDNLIFSIPSIEVDAFSVNAEQNLKSFIYQRKFVSCQRLLRQHTQRISEKFGRLRSAAILVIDPDVAPTTIQRFLNGKKKL